MIMFIFKSKDKVHHPFGGGQILALLKLLMFDLVFLETQCFKKKFTVSICPPIGFCENLYERLEMLSNLIYFTKL